jgi:hypothetical protein
VKIHKFVAPGTWTKANIISLNHRVHGHLLGLTRTYAIPHLDRIDAVTMQVFLHAGDVTLILGGLVTAGDRVQPPVDVLQRGPLPWIHPRVQIHEQVIGNRQVHIVFVGTLRQLITSDFFPAWLGHIAGHGMRYLGQG